MAGRIVEIVLTGGPAGGKTTALSILSQKIADWGFRVLLAPEVATMLISGGITDIGLIAASPEKFLVLERHFLAFQRALRQRYQAMASDAFGDENVVVIYDRGESDVMAYVGPDGFARLLSEAGLSTADVRDSYDGVIHLVSAAVGALEAYTTANNSARQETPAEAADLDKRTLAAWIGHPHLRVIDNSTDFAAKMHRTLAACARLLGVPEPLEIERRFRLLTPPSVATLTALGAKAIDIEQIYLPDVGDHQVRIRRRGVGVNAMYYRTEKVRRTPTTRVEIERVISRREYQALAAEADPARSPIRKVRHCFAAGGAYFELDEFLSHKGLWILEVELASDADEVTLPPILGALVEVTGDESYSNGELARV